MQYSWIGHECINTPHSHGLPLPGSVLMTTEVGTNKHNDIVAYEFLWIYVGHVTIFRLMFIIACCFVVGLGLGLGLGLYLVSGWLAVMHTYLYHFRLSMRICNTANKRRHRNQIENPVTTHSRTPFRPSYSGRPRWQLFFVCSMASWRWRCSKIERICQTLSTTITSCRYVSWFRRKTKPTQRWNCLITQL